MTKHAPTVMISSTFYDLRQIRQDLANFIEKDLGYNALLSEFDSFPIDPDTDTIENCRRRVEKDADILVLIIGGRYGYIDKTSNKSVTNLEYLTARAKGIPIYAFIDKSVLPLLPIWEKNPKAKFSNAVSDTKVFEFIRQVRSIDKVWAYEFEHAQTIIQTLRIQFAYLMREGLEASNRLNLNQGLIPADINGKALRLALEKPNYWEYYLFAQVLINEVVKYSDIREQHRLQLIFSQGETVATGDIFEWVLRKTAEIKRLGSVVADLVNTHLKTALGPAGLPGDQKALIFTAKKVGEVYRQALEWSLSVRHAHTANCLRPVIEEMAGFADDLINKVGGWGEGMIQQIDEARLLADGSKGGPQTVVKIQLNIGTSAGENLADLLKECLENCEEE